MPVTVARNMYKEIHLKYKVILNTYETFDVKTVLKFKNSGFLSERMNSHLIYQ